MNSETSEMPLDGMTVHPDWNHIETLTIHPDCDTLIVVPGHALFKRETDARSPLFDPRKVDFWSLNEYQDLYEIRLLIEHVHAGVVSAATDLSSILVFSGGCTRIAGDGWTEGSSYYEVAEYFNWWGDETRVPLHVMKTKSFVDVFSFDSMDNLWMSIRLFQLAHPRKEVPKKVVIIACTFKEKRYQLHAAQLGIPTFEYIGMENPINIDEAALSREQNIINVYKKDPFCEDVSTIIWKKKFKRNFQGIEYPYGRARDVMESYRKQFHRRKAE